MKFSTILWLLLLVSVTAGNATGTQKETTIKSGFKKTAMTLKNKQTTYNVWQKSFSAGKVGLGVNGFENGLALHYFVSVAPQHKGDQLKISNFFPENQQIGILQDGASSYQDGTAYIISVGIPNRDQQMTDEPYAEVRNGAGTSLSIC